MAIPKMPEQFRVKTVPSKSATKHTEAVVESTHSKVDLNSRDFQKFLNKAPTGMEQATASRWKMRGRKVMITVQLDPEMLEQFDELCSSLGQSRSALIRTFIGQALEKMNGGPKF